jgi:hypothetical protein
MKATSVALLSGDQSGNLQKKTVRLARARAAGKDGRVRGSRVDALNGRNSFPLNRADRRSGLMEAALGKCTFLKGVRHDLLPDASIRYQLDVFVLNRGFGRDPHEAEIFGFWGDIDPNGAGRTLLGAHHFRSAEKEGYPARK